MASKNVIFGTGAALAGLGGLAAAAVTVNTAEQTTPTKAAATTIETQTVVVRTVEHRIERLKAKRHRRPQHASTAATATAPAPAPVVQASPVRIAASPAPVTSPVRTRTSGGSGTTGGDDGGEHDSQHSSDDSGEHADD